LDPVSGFLSIDVINVLGASNLGIYVTVEAAATQHLCADPEGEALVNWNNQHWTTLRRESNGGAWIHMNSIVDDGGLRHGCVRCASPHDVERVLAEIRRSSGGVTLHHITRSDRSAGPRFLEREGMQAMHGVAIREACGDDGEGHGDPAPAPVAAVAEISVVTVNVDGLGTYRASPAARMEEILNQIVIPMPDMFWFQEVLPEMYGVIRRRLADWKIHRRRHVTEDYVNVTAVRTALASARDKTTSFAFPTSS
jgi:hypothetical protein